MKKIIVYGLSILMLTVLCVGFTACGGSDDEGGFGAQPGGVVSALVGQWKYSFSTGYQIYEFNNDGTGYYQEYDTQDGGWHRKHNFTYRYDASNKTITIVESGKTADVYIVIELTSTTLVMYQPSSSKGYKNFTKQ